MIRESLCTLLDAEHVAPGVRFARFHHVLPRYRSICSSFRRCPVIDKVIVVHGLLIRYTLVVDTIT